MKKATKKASCRQSQHQVKVKVTEWLKSAKVFQVNLFYCTNLGQLSFPTIIDELIGQEISTSESEFNFEKMY